MSKEYLSGERESSRSYSRAVKVKGGTTVYLAGVGGAVDRNGKSLAGDFPAQTDAAFARIRDTLARSAEPSTTSSR